MILPSSLNEKTLPIPISLFLQALSIWAHTNDVRRILSVFFHGI